MDRITNLSLVVAELTPDYKKNLFGQASQVQAHSRQVTGSIVTSDGGRLGFTLDSISSVVENTAVLNFITRNCLFERSCHPISVTIGSGHGLNPNKPIGKYVSEFVLAHQTAGGVTSFSTLYADARRFRCEQVIDDFEGIALGKVISISRKLSVPGDLVIAPRDHQKTTLIQGSGQAFFQESRVTVWKLQGIDEKGWKLLPELKRQTTESAIEWFLLKYMRMRTGPNETGPPDQIKVSRRSY